MSTVPNAWKYGIAEMTGNVLLGVMSGKVTTIGKATTYALNGWIFGVGQKTMKNLFGGRLKKYH